jgi:hypothetical protein
MTLLTIRTMPMSTSTIPMTPFHDDLFILTAYHRGETGIRTLEPRRASCFTEAEGIEPPKAMNPSRFQGGVLDQPDYFQDPRRA